MESNIKKCSCCGCKIDLKKDYYYKAFLKDYYYCELHDMVGQDIDEEKWQ